MFRVVAYARQAVVSLKLGILVSTTFFMFTALKKGGKFAARPQRRRRRVR